MSDAEIDTRIYAYPQYVQGIDSQGSDFFSKDDNLFEKKIFKVEKNKDQIKSLLNKMVPLFEYSNNKLRYLKSESGDFEYLTLVLMSVKEKTSLDYSYFTKEKTSGSKKRMNGFILLYKIAYELEKLHRANIIHGCLKPENIYLDSNDDLYIANYGLRQIMDENINCVNQPETSTSFLSYLNLKGTVYEPPEMRKIKRFTHSSEIELYNGDVDEDFFGKEINSDFYTAKMDVYAFGILFYEIMIRDRLKLENMTVKNDSIFPGDRHFPDAIKALIMQCLSINPSDRPSFPAILSAMTKICDDNQYNLKEVLQDDTDNRQDEIEIIIPFDSPKADILNLFLKAYSGDVESLIVAFQILEKHSENIENYGLGNKLESIEIDIIKSSSNDKKNDNRINESILNPSLIKDEDLSFEKSGATQIDKYKIIGNFVYPKTITVPLISYEISSLSKVDSNDSISKCYENLKKIALDTKDPSLLLYLAFNSKHKQAQGVSRSPSFALLKSGQISRSMSNVSMASSVSISNLADPKEEYKILMKDLELAAKFGSSEALVFLGCLKLLQIEKEGVKGKEEEVIRKQAAYYFKVASDMYNPYGMINFGIMLEGLEKEEIMKEKEEELKKDKSSEKEKLFEQERKIKKENSNALAGKYFILASQSSLEVDIGKRGLDLYNKEIEMGLVDDEASRKYDIPKNRWVDWFLTMPAGRLFVHASEECISKSNECSSNFQSSHQTVEKTKEEMKKRGKSEKEVIDTDLKVAKEYGKKIHPLYTTKDADFIQDIVDKYQKTTDFPRCPRVLCYGQTCFPVGPLFIEGVENEKIQNLNENMCVHFYCPRCNDFYLPSQVLYRNISSSYFPRNYLPKALRKLYKDEDIPTKKPFVQYVPTIHGIPMMEVKKSKMKKPVEDIRDGTDAAGFFLVKDEKDQKASDIDDF